MYQNPHYTQYTTYPFPQKGDSSVRNHDHTAMYNKNTVQFIKEILYLLLFIITEKNLRIKYGDGC